MARPGELALGVLRELGADVLTVSEESLARALLLCLERAKQVVEPAGAAGVAALLDRPEKLTPPVAVVLSGGNIDPLLLAKLLRRGLSAAGRYLSFRCRLPDQPGALATLLTELAAWARTCSTSCTPGSRRTCGSARSRSRCRWKPAARGTPTRSSASSARPATH